MSTIRLTVDEGPKKGETLARAPGGAAIRIGRVLRGNTLAIRDSTISQKHLSIGFDSEASRWAVTDLGASNGTSVNGVRLAPAAPFPLSDGDSVRIGGSTLISIRIEDVGGEAVEGSRRVGGKRGRRGGASVRVSVTEDRIEPPKRGRTVGVDGTGDEDDLGRGRGRSSSRVLKKDEILDSVRVEDELGRGRRRNSSRVLKKDEILDLACMEDITHEAPMKLPRGRRGNCLRNSKVDEVLSTSLVDPSGETANVGRGRRERGKANSVWKQDQVADMVVEHEIVVQDRIVDPVPLEDVAEVPKKLTRGRRGHSSRVLKTDVAMDIRTMETVSVESSKSRESLGRERRGILATVSQKGEAVVPVVEVSIDVPKKFMRGRRGNSSSVSKTNETMDIQTTDTVVADSSQVKESSRREKRGILAKVSQKGEASVPAVEGSIVVPKNLGRGKRSTRTQTLKKDEVLNSVAEENIERPKTLRRGRSSSNMGLKKERVLDLAPESSTQLPKNVGRTRRTGSNKVLKDDGDLAPDSSTQVPKNVGRKKVLKDDEVSDSIVEGSVKVPQGLNRGSRIASSQVSKKNETLDSVIEDRTEDPVNWGRGKKRACSSRVSKKDDVVDSVEESIRVPVVQEGRPRRAPARRTRAASARLSTKELLESAPLNLKGPLNPVENIYHHKVLTGHSNQLGQSEKIHNVSFTASSPKEFNRSQNREEFNKENHSLVKSQRRENKGPSSGGVANGAEPSDVLLKVWNGNGIPNTTSKYKEDSKVSFHATPFEERLEKALSGDKLVPQRS